VKLTTAETPKLSKPKRRTSASKPDEDKKEESKPTLEVESPVSILKGGKNSRDHSKDSKGSREASKDRKISRDPSKDKVRDNHLETEVVRISGLMRMEDLQAGEVWILMMEHLMFCLIHL